MKIRLIDGRGQLSFSVAGLVEYLMNNVTVDKQLINRDLAERLASELIDELTVAHDLQALNQKAARLKHGLELIEGALDGFNILKPKAPGAVPGASC